MKKIVFILLIFFIFILGCSKSKTKKKNNFEIFKSKIYQYELIDNSDIVPYFKNCLKLYNKMQSDGIFRRNEVTFLSNNFLKIYENFPGSRYADDSLYFAGKLYMDLMEYDKTIRYFEKIIEEYPDGIFSKLSNEFHYKFHIAPLAHFLYARIYHIHKGSIFKAYWEYRKLIRNYAKYMDERYILNGEVGHVFAESQFYMAEIAKNHTYNYRLALKYYRRTVLRYSGLVWQNHKGETIDFRHLSLDKMYQLGLDHPGTIRLVISNFEEMTVPNKDTYEDSRMLIGYYLGNLYLKIKNYNKAINSYQKIFTDNLNINYEEDVEIILKTIKKLHQLEQSENKYIRNLAKDKLSTIDICHSLIRGESNKLLVAELLLYLSRRKFKEKKSEEALTFVRKLFRKYQYIVSLDGELILRNAVKLMKNNLSSKEYHKFLEKNLFFLSRKFDLKEELMREMKEYENKRDS